MINVIDRLMEALACASPMTYAFAYDAPETRNETNRILISIRRVRTFVKAEDVITFDCKVDASIKYTPEMCAMGALVLAIPETWVMEDSKGEVRIKANDRTEDIRAYGGTMLESTLSFDFHLTTSYDETKATLNQIIWSEE